MKVVTSEIFWHFCEKNLGFYWYFFARFSKFNSICPEKPFKQNLFDRKDMFLIPFGLGDKKFSTLGKKFETFYQNCILRVNTKVFYGISLDGKTYGFITLFEQWKKTRASIQKLPTRLSKLHSSSPADNLRKKVYREIYKILINFGLLVNFLWIFGQKNLLGLSKVPPTCPEEQLEEKEFVLYKVTCRIFLDSDGKFSDFWQKFPAGILKYDSRCPENFVWRIFPKKRFCDRFRALRGWNLGLLGIQF